MLQINKMKNNDTFLPHLSLGEHLPGKSLLKGILPHEMWYDNGSYYSVLCIYPNGKRVIDFEDRFAAVKKSWSALLMPVYYLVAKGATVSYFVLYIRKFPLVAS